MGEESPKPARTPQGAVFLSYASEDAEVAARIATALRDTGVEVWFDREELRGGDSWDQKIRQQIFDCRLFVPIISANTEARLEGYFRREWKLAGDRTESMASELAFLFPVVIDSTPNTSAHVPEKFRHVQWTRLAGGQVSPAFVERVRRLLDASSPQAATWVRRGASPPPSSMPRVRQPWGGSPVSWVAGVVLAMALGYIAVDKVWVSRHSLPSSAPAVPAARQTALGAGAAPATAAAFAPPPHSIAVLPFVNMSGDKEQEYFSDGLTEELLNSLARINELQVAARTSAFSFKGKDTDLGTIARKLNVGAILEGSVRRSGHTIRITAQLDNAVTGFHLWSQTFDRDLRDVLKLQSEIANDVANALKVNLLGDVAAKIELGGTHNPAAFDAFLRAVKDMRSAEIEKGVQRAVSGYTTAIRLDPEYALAYARRSTAYRYLAREFVRGTVARDYRAKATVDARKAVALAPDLAEAHVALANLLDNSLEFTAADSEYRRAVTLAPGNAEVLKAFGLFAVYMGHTEAGLAAAQRAVRLDPLDFGTHVALGESLTLARRYREAIEALNHAKALGGDRGFIDGWLGYAYYKSGDLENARAKCESETLWNRFICMAMVYEKLGRRADARDVVAKFRASQGDAAAVFYASIYAEWGDHASALDWLEIAMRQRSPYLEFVRSLESFDPLRNEPRFQAIEEALRFPD